MKNIVLFLLVQLVAVTVAAQQRTQLIVHAPVLAPEDTLVALLQQQRIVEAHRNPYHTMKGTDRVGLYRFDMDSVENWSWISMNLSYQRFGSIDVPNILEEFLLEKGDSVHIYLQAKKGSFVTIENGYNGNIPMLRDNWHATFAGRGAAKFEAWWKIKVLNDEARREQLLLKVGGNPLTRYLRLLYDLQRESLEVLQAFKHLMTDRAFNLLELQVKGKFGYELAQSIETLQYHARNKDEATKSVVREQLDIYLQQGLHDLRTASGSEFESPMYVDYLTKYLTLAFKDQYGGNGNMVRDGYIFIRDFLPASFLRDRILGSFLLARFQQAPQAEVLQDALSIVSEPYSVERITRLSALIKGQESYAFALPDASGRLWKAEHFKGKVLFMDFWYAACTPCRQYMKNVVIPVKEHFKDNSDVVFVTVSTDNLDTFKKMVDNSDFLPKGGIHLYTDNQYFRHPLVQHYQIRSFPYPLLIGRSGEVVGNKTDLMTIPALIKEIETALGQ